MAQIRVMEIKRVFDILEKLKLNSTKKDVLNTQLTKLNYIKDKLIYI